MSIMYGALRPDSEAPSRPWPVELGTTNFVNSNVADNTLPALRSQPGRIIATHWLRLEADLASRLFDLNGGAA